MIEEIKFNNVPQSFVKKKGTSIYERILKERERLNSDDSKFSSERNYRTQPCREKSNSPLNLNKLRKTNFDLIKNSLSNFEMSFRDILDEK